MSDIRKADRIIREAFISRFEAPTNDFDLDLADEVLKALSLLTRRKTTRRAPYKSRKLTSAEMAAIQKITVAEPDASFAAIGLRFGVNAGRISEICHGLYRPRE